MLANSILLTVALAIILAQVSKVPIYYLRTKQWQWRLMLSTGYMPSSHATAVWSLVSAVALQEGMQSTFFAISLVFACLVTYDATGVRYEAGKHAERLNTLTPNAKPLKTALGHKKSEAFAGALAGIIFALLVHALLHFN